MTTEFERRRREEALRRARRRALLVTAAVAPPALAVAAAFSPLLDVDTVRVAGTARADVARAAAAAAHGHPLATVDTAAVRRDVLALRGVKSVTVSRSWPSALTVRVVERVPVVAVPRPGSIDLYDTEGVLVDRVGQVPPGTPRLAVATGGAPGREVVTAAVDLLRALPPALRVHVRDLRADGPASLSFSFADGAQVVWGNGERTPEKVRALELLVRQHARRYDVRVPDRPAVVPR